MKQHSFSATLALGSGSTGRLHHRPQSSYGRVLPVKFSPSPGESSGCSRLVFLSTMASADFSAFTPPIAERGAAVLPPPHVSEISPGKDAVLLRTAAAFTSTTEPVGFAVLCQLAPSCRPCMRFLFIGSRFSPSLPPHGRSPFGSWLQLVFYFSWLLHRGLEPLLALFAMYDPTRPHATGRCWRFPPWD